MNTALTTNSYISVSPARKAFAFKPSYKTACRVAIGINTILASAFLLSFPLLRIAETKCPAQYVLQPEYIFTSAGSEKICLLADTVLSNRVKAGFSESNNFGYRHTRFERFQNTSDAFKEAHKSWGTDL